MSARWWYLHDDRTGKVHAATIEEVIDAERAHGPVREWYRGGQHEFGPLGRVSTCFIGLDAGRHILGERWSGEAPPRLWETMIFGGLLDQATVKYTSEQAARAGHLRACWAVLLSPLAWLVRARLLL